MAANLLMLWTSAGQSFLAAGGAPNFHCAFIASPVLRASGLREPVGYWSGHEQITLDLGGSSRVLWPTYGALIPDDPSFEVGTSIRSHRTRLHGLDSDAMRILQTYEARFAPAEIWQLMFSQGLELIDTRRLIKGAIDGAPQKIGKKGGTASLEVRISTTAREGTKPIGTRKSHASYLARSGDTALEYASLTDVDSDWWGARG